MYNYPGGYNIPGNGLPVGAEESGYKHDKQQTLKVSIFLWERTRFYTFLIKTISLKHLDSPPNHPEQKLWKSR